MFFGELPQAGEAMGDTPRSVQGLVREPTECDMRLAPVVERLRTKWVEVQMKTVSVMSEEMLVIVRPSMNQPRHYPHEGPSLVVRVIRAEGIVPTWDMFDAVLFWDLVRRLIWNGRARFDTDSPDVAPRVSSIAAVQCVSRELRELLLRQPMDSLHRLRADGMSTLRQRLPATAAQLLVS